MSPAATATLTYEEELEATMKALEEAEAPDVQQLSPDAVQTPMWYIAYKTVVSD